MFWHWFEHPFGCSSWHIYGTSVVTLQLPLLLSAQGIEAEKKRELLSDVNDVWKALSVDRSIIIVENKI